MTFDGPKLLCKMLPVREFNAIFIFAQTNLTLNAIKNVNWNNVAYCDENRVNQGFLKMLSIIALLYYVHLIKNWNLKYKKI